MEKIATSSRVSLPPSLLYVDDIEQLVEILRGAGYEVTLRCPGYKLDSAAELIELGKKLRQRRIYDLDISAGNILIGLSPHQSWMFLRTDANSTLGVAAKVREFFGRKRKLFSPLRLFLLLNAIAMALSLAPGGASQLRAILALGLVALGVWLGLKKLPPYCLIYAVRRADKPSFLQKHGGALAIAIAGAVIGALVTKFVDRIF